MKKFRHILIVLLLVNASFLKAQAPQGFKYQTSVRDNSGNLLANKLVAIKLSLIKDSAYGTTVYSEKFNVSTNDFGIANLNVGSGNALQGTFTSINWNTGSFFLKIDMDMNNGTNFQYMGTSQLLSVPFAMYATKSGSSVDDADKDPTNEIQTLSVTGNKLNLSQANQVNIDADTTNELQQLSLSNNTIQLNKNGGNIDLTKFAVDSQLLSLQGNTLSISKGNNVRLNDIDSTNELQLLTLVNDTLKLSKNGGNINLLKYAADSQSLVLSGKTLSISRGNSIVLTGAIDLDADPTNELQKISLHGDTLGLTSDTSFVLLIDNDTLNEIQTLSKSNDTISLSKSNFIILTKDNDRDSTNEIQTLSLNRNNLALSKSNQVSIDADTTNEIQTLNFINDSLKISKGNSIYMPQNPIGSIIAFGGRNIPNGWLVCNGDSISRTTFFKLFQVIDSTWGAGNHITTFNLPDLRGQFLRGVNGTATIDADTSSRNNKYSGGNTGNNVGSYQQDELKSHNHSFYALGTGGNSLFSGYNGGNNSYNTTSNTGGSETRPKNAYVYYIIKY